MDYLFQKIRKTYKKRLKNRFRKKKKMGQTYVANQCSVIKNKVNI